MYFWLPIQEPSCRIGLVEAAFASVGESVVDRGHLCGRKGLGTKGWPRIGLVWARLMQGLSVGWGV